jgi:putative transposase
MSTPRYLWRQLTPRQREELLAWRKQCGYPWHSPPHRPNFGHLNFLISASCYEHKHYIGYSRSAWTISAVIFWKSWRRTRIARLHGACYQTTITLLSRQLMSLGCWPQSDSSMDAAPFVGTAKKEPVVARFFIVAQSDSCAPIATSGRRSITFSQSSASWICRAWTDWFWSSARDYLEQMGREEAQRIWREHPLKDYGQKWDPPEL